MQLPIQSLIRSAYNDVEHFYKRKERGKKNKIFHLSISTNDLHCLLCVWRVCQHRFVQFLSCISTERKLKTSNQIICIFFVFSAILLLFSDGKWINIIWMSFQWHSASSHLVDLKYIENDLCKRHLSDIFSGVNDIYRKMKCDVNFRVDVNWRKHKCIQRVVA